MTQTATELRAPPEELHTASRSPAIDTTPLVLIADDEPTARLL